MSDDGREQIAPELRRIQEAIQQMPRPRPDPDYLASARRAFLQGSLDTERVTPVPRRPQQRWMHWLQWTLVPTAAVAALVLLFFLSQGPIWTIHHIYGAGEVEINGEILSLEEEDRLRDLVRPGHHLRLGPEAGLELRCGDLAVIEVTPGSHVTIPTRPGRWTKRTMRSDVALGEIRVATGPDFSDHAFHIFTPEGRINLTGTIISVFRNPDLTCVCILEGDAMIGKDETHLDPIPEGMRKVMFRDGRAPLISEISAEHLQGLLEFRERNKGAFDE